MALPTDINPFVQFAGGASGDLGDPINQSLRFVGSQSLNKAFSQNWQSNITISLWLKRANLGGNYYVFLLDTGGNNIPIAFDTSDRIKSINGSGTGTVSTAKFRDTSAWYHIVVNNSYLWVNGQEILSNPNNLISGHTGQDDCYIGVYGVNNIHHYKGQIADVYLIDGQTKDKDDFGRYNEDGVWVPKNYEGTYGNNGFHLTFDSSAGLGDDTSGNGNDFTATSFETTAVSASNFDNDIDYKDTPTSNYATLQSLDKGKGGGNDGDANLAVWSNSSGQWQGTRLSTQLASSGKWYFEVQDNQPEMFIGVADDEYWAQLLTWNTVPFGAGSSGNSLGYYTYNGNKYENGTITSYGPSGSAGDIFMVAWDGDTGTIWVGRNGTWNNSATESEIVAGTTTNAMFTGKTGEDWRLGVCHAYTDSSKRAKVNFGQRPFIYTPPSGYKELENNQHSEPTIKQGSKHFGLLKYSAPGSPSYPVTINGIGGGLAGDGELLFDDKPDLVWIKMTNGSQNNILFDSLRGNTKSLRSDENISEVNRTNFDFVNNGLYFTAADAETYTQNDTYIARCWKAGGAPTITNSNTAGTSQTAGSVKVDGADGSFAHGTIKANKMSVNTTAGFSIVQYTGTQVAGSIPHGLGAVPEMAIVKRTDATGDWHVYHKDLDGDATRQIYLDQGSTQSGTSSDYWNNTLPTSTTFTLGGATQNNTSGGEYIAYLWTSIPGYSKFGGYRGNGSSGVNGTFVYTGFKPSFLMVRVYSQSGNWMMWDTLRSPTNPVQNRVLANLAQAEASYASQEVDILSNGFKLRGADSDVNESYFYIYMAFAESPFVGENTAPVPAR